MNYPDCEFGGKTGTSNNHSDAWFVATSPNLVCATWVGGEYRCIHFRTGQLGQGSRAALPLCGYFLEAVLADPKLKRYHGKYTKPDATITRAMYECSYFSSYRSDTIDVDSLGGAGGMVFDEGGNPVSNTSSEASQEGAAASAEPTTENATE